MFQPQQQLSPQAKILIVDDRADNLELLSTVCKLQGYEVIKSDRGSAAIELAKNDDIDLILLDICMPEMDGFTVCKLLKEDSLTKDIPIVFISVLGEIANKTQAFELGGNDYITKPFQIEDVVARIEVQLKFKALQAELKEKYLQLDREKQVRLAAEVRLLQLNQKVSELTTLDELTAIANRHYFDEILTKEWCRAQKEKFSLGLILCDIDYFKQYNDTLGHESGNICLRQVAKTISAVAENFGGVAARYSGDKFAIILSPTTPKDALNTAEKIRLQIRKLNIFHPSSSNGDRISLSLGVTLVLPDLKYDKKQLLFTANEALQLAKERGRNHAILKSIS